MRNRFRLAIAVSFLGHGILTFVFVQFYMLLRQPPGAKNAIVDRRIDAPEGYAPLTLRFDETPPSPTQAPPLPAPSPSPNPLPLSPKIEPVSFHENASETPNSSKETHRKQSGSAGNRQSAAPLHGKLTKPGFSVVYVLDRSGSMGKDCKLVEAISILKASLDQLGPEVRFQIVTYDSRATVARIGNSLDLVTATTANIAAAGVHLADIVGEGSSRHSEGLRIGLGMHPDLLILLTDADELSTNDVKQLKEWNRKGTAIHAVLIGASPTFEKSRLQELAGSGHVHFIASPITVQ